ncbi:MAG: hypothetical protein LBV41_03015 [Cytophagaceae bacterium]|jgi:hypothetical protein|nr:hypothetical protein [Cytophagaceae bacterium]
MKARLTSEVIARINHPKNTQIKQGLKKPLCITSYPPVWYMLKANEWNGNLTKEAVLQYLEDTLGMTRDQLLETIDE